MRVELRGSTQLLFDDGEPVRAASAVAPYEGGWLVAQDDATHGAWWRGERVERLRLLPAVEGHDVFSSAAGTKHLKPDLETACPVPGGVLLLGSGSTPARMRGVLLRAPGEPVVGHLAPLYDRVRAALGLDTDLLNLEGAALAGGTLRWFQRGAATLPSASVDVDLAALLAGFDAPDRIPLGPVRTYDLGTVDGVPLAVTDAVALPDGRVVVSAAAEDTPNPYDDGPVVGAALALLDGERVLDVVELPDTAKVEGLALRGVRGGEVSLLGVVDADDPSLASVALELVVGLG